MTSLRNSTTAGSIPESCCSVLQQCRYSCCGNISWFSLLHLLMSSGHYCCNYILRFCRQNVYYINMHISCALSVWSRKMFFFAKVELCVSWYYLCDMLAVLCGDRECRNERAITARTVGSWAVLMEESCHCWCITAYPHHGHSVICTVSSWRVQYETVIAHGDNYIYSYCFEYTVYTRV